MEPVLNTMADYLVRQSCQISVLFLLVAAACWGLRKASAHWRYLLWLVVLAKCLVPALISLPLAVLPQNAESQPAAPFTIPAPAVAVASEFETAFEDSEPTATPSMAAPQEVATSPGIHVANTISSNHLKRRDWLAMAWLSGAGLFLTYVSIRASTAHRKLKRSRQAADREIRAAVAALAERLGVSMVPTIYMVDGIAQPFVWGWLRGSIYLPQQFVSTGTPEQRQAILTHELAHVARWDAAANLVQVIAQAVFFFHPLIWWTNRKIRQEREKCCDEIVLAGLGTQPMQYSEAIVNALVTEYEANYSTPSLAVAGRMKNIEERVKTILTLNRRFYRRPSWVAVATVLFVAACAVPTALVLTSRGSPAEPPPESASQPVSPTTTDTVAQTQDNLPPAETNRWQPGQVLDFRVINARTKEPLPDVKLVLQFSGKGIDFQAIKIQRTDVQGRSQIRLPDRQPDAVRVYPVKAGFVPLRVYWGSAPSPSVFSKTVTVPMEPGTTFGGVIRNEEGKPIPGVTVTVHYWEHGLFSNPHLRANIDEKVTSDQDGRWQVDIMPAEIVDDGPRIFLAHRDYVSDRRRGNIPIPITKRPPIEALREQTAVMVMRKGATIKGRVIDRAGRPISGASVYDEEHYWTNSGKPAAVTDKDGRFQIRAVKSGKTILTVQAPRYSPEVIETHVGRRSVSSLEIGLKPGQTVQGRVVDESDKPVEGVSISAVRWREHHGRLNLAAKTDADGKFRLTDAPSDEVQYYFFKKGYMMVEYFPMSPSPKEYVATLKSRLWVVGAVLDAETDKPLAKFSLIPGFDYDDGRAPDWQRSRTTTITAGRYETNFEQEGFSYRIRVEAEGYMPAVSRILRPYNPDKGRVTYDFKLTKADPLTGTVLGPDDEPLAGAEVYLATHKMMVSDGKASSSSLINNRMVRTNSAGRFEFPPEVEPFYLVVLHDQGYAMITEKQFADSPAVTIQPWTTEKRILPLIRRR